MAEEILVDLGEERERILAQRDAERLERWLAKAVVAASIGDVLDE